MQALAVATSVAAIVASATAAPSSLWPKEGWPTSLKSLRDCTVEEFQSFAKPFADMCLLSYVATRGSYYNPDKQNATVDSWERIGALTEDPPDGGMRALTFLQKKSGRGVVVYRGTDLNTSSPGGQADRCADALLFDEDPLPVCGELSKKLLNYRARASEFAKKAAEKYPEVEWAYTGHSLGAALAELVAAERNAIAFTFASPPVSPALQRIKMTPGEVATWATVSVYDEWDPLGWKARGRLFGTACAYTSSETPACKACDVPKGTLDEWHGQCYECLMSKHTFGGYLKHLKSDTRPKCGPWPRELHV